MSDTSADTNTGNGENQEKEERGVVNFHLSRRVITADAELGILYFEDGSQVQADLIIAADGLHSVLKGVVLKDEVQIPAKTGFNAFRFQIPTEELVHDERFQELLKQKGNGPSVLADMRNEDTMEHMVWYDCQK